MVCIFYFYLSFRCSEFIIIMIDTICYEAFMRQNAIINKSMALKGYALNPLFSGNQGWY